MCIRDRLNPKLEFAETYMEAIGFRKCGTCKKRELEMLVHINDKNISNYNGRTIDLIDLPF